jgi:hypothetical protein
MKSMTRRSTNLPRRRLAAAALAACAMAATLPVAAQQQSSQTQAAAPGWVFTPSIAVAETWDNNVLLRGEGDGGIGDFLTAVSPQAALGFRGRRSTFHLDYRGSYYLYQELNAFDQRAAADFRHRVSRTVNVFARQSLSKSPTTDDVDLPGVEFRRQGVLHADFRSGIEARLNPRATVNGSYTFQQVTFDEDPTQPINALRGGGYAHGGAAQVDYRINPRLAVGGEFDMRNATLDDGRGFDVRNTLGTVDLRLAKRLELSGGVGYSWLATEDDEPGRSAPAFRVGLNGSGARFAWNVTYRRSFLPSFGFGGTFENQEFQAGFLAPLTRRLDWSSSFAVRESDPLTTSDLGLRSIWARSSISYLATRWMRVEGFYAAVLQDSQRAGGRVNRSRAGIQVVTSTRMRIR